MDVGEIKRKECEHRLLGKQTHREETSRKTVKLWKNHTLKEKNRGRGGGRREGKLKDD